MSKYYSNTIKIISTITLIAFLCAQLAWADGGAASHLRSRQWLEKNTPASAVRVTENSSGIDIDEACEKLLDKGYIAVPYAEGKELIVTLRTPHYGGFQRLYLDVFDTGNRNRIGYLYLYAKDDNPAMFYDALNILVEPKEESFNPDVMEFLKTKGITPADPKNRDLFLFNFDEEFLSQNSSLDADKFLWKLTFKTMKHFSAQKIRIKIPATSVERYKGFGFGDVGPAIFSGRIMELYLKNIRETKISGLREFYERGFKNEDAHVVNLAARYGSALPEDELAVYMRWIDDFIKNDKSIMGRRMANQTKEESIRLRNEAIATNPMNAASNDNPGDTADPAQELRIEKLDAYQPVPKGAPLQFIGRYDKETYELRVLPARSGNKDARDIEIVNLHIDKEGAPHLILAGFIRDLTIKEGRISFEGLAISNYQRIAGIMDAKNDIKGSFEDKINIVLQESQSACPSVACEIILARYWADNSAVLKEQIYSGKNYHTGEVFMAFIEFLSSLMPNTTELEWNRPNMLTRGQLHLAGDPAKSSMAQMTAVYGFVTDAVTVNGMPALVFKKSSTQLAPNPPVLIPVKWKHPGQLGPYLTREAVTSSETATRNPAGAAGGTTFARADGGNHSSLVAEYLDSIPMHDIKDEEERIFIRKLEAPAWHIKHAIYNAPVNLDH